jgi:tRNA (cytidine/uridine-2'-O-)-methyltransferase
VNVVLLEPEIPPNTGNVARLCAVADAHLHLVGPLGFRLDDKALKRAGMDYWEHVKWTYWDSWEAFTGRAGREARFWFVENKTQRLYTQVRYGEGDYLVFGRETVGVPESLLEANWERVIAVPQFNAQARSLNLSNCVAIVLYEALRQVRGF